MLDRALHDGARIAHPLDGFQCQLDALTGARNADHLVESEIRSGEDDGQAQTTEAVSAIVSSFARWSSTVSALPRTEVAKPHWGESARRSSGQ